MSNENKNEEVEMYDTNGLLVHLDDISTKRLSRREAAFDPTSDNFYQLTEAVSLEAADGWIEFEKNVVAPHVAENGLWLRETLTKWPIAKVELGQKAQTSEREARGRFVDVIERTVRERVQIEEGEKEPAVATAVQIAEPVKAVAVLEAEGSSEAEKQWEDLTVQLRKNRVSAIGVPSRSLLSLSMPSAKVKFGVTLISSLIMSMVEGSLNLDITGSVMGPAAKFAFTFVITVLSNLLILFGVEMCHHLLTYRSAKNAYASLDQGTRAAYGKPQAPDSAKWVVGIGALSILAIATTAFVWYRLHLIANDSTLAGMEAGTIAIPVCFCVSIFIELMVTTPVAKYFVNREKEIAAQIRAIQDVAANEARLREARNAEKIALCEADYEAKLAAYRQKLEEAAKPAPDPIEVANAAYQAEVSAAELPVKTLLGTIKAQLAYRVELLVGYRQVHTDVYLPGVEELIDTLMRRLEGGGLDVDKYLQAGPTARIAQYVKTAAPLALVDPELDALIKDFNPAVNDIETLTQIEPLILQFAEDELGKILRRRNEQREQQLNAEHERLEISRRNAERDLRRKKRFVLNGQAPTADQSAETKAETPSN